MNPEQQARQQIDAKLVASEWAVQDYKAFIFRINTSIMQGGSKVEAGFYVDKREHRTRKVSLEQLHEVLAYDADNLDRDVVAPDQIRTVLATNADISDASLWRV
ncbi:MAG: hypothetical protein WDM80_12585 [Limisphaerales bacterium]